MNANVKLTPEAVDAYNALQAKKVYNWVRMGFSDDLKKVELKETGDSDSTFDKLLAATPKDHTSFIAYNCEYKTSEGQDRSHVLLVCYSDDNDNNRTEKMLASSTTGQFKTQCKSHQKFACVNSRDELNHENFVDLCKTK